MADMRNRTPFYGAVPTSKLNADHVFMADGTTVEEALTDYIVEEGTDGIWTYRKWKSGFIEAWCENSKTWAMTSAYGAVYFASDTLNLPTGLFTTVNSVIASRGGDVNGAGLINVTVNNATTTSLTFLVYNFVSDTRAATISFYITGT